MRSRAALFWSSLGLTLLLILPLIGAVTYFSAQRSAQERVRQANTVTSGVTVEPGAQFTATVLVVVQQEEPGFVLLRLDAPAASLTLCGLPSSLRVNAPSGTTTLADCSQSAGPARAAQLLGQTVGAAPQFYLAATPACLAGLWEQGTAARLDTSALLDADARRDKGLSGDPVVEFGPEDAASLLAQLSLGQNAPAAARLRVSIWSALLRQNPAQMPELIGGLRAASARTLTDLRAQDLNTVEQTMEYLCASPSLTITAAVPSMTSCPGQEWELTQEGTEQLLEILQ
ncbi:MAG: hypothetical protein PUA63_01880 [Oscillospiraceae bacterium]|nr:hypothetical protein [Oscillospiraceae bacterium]